MSLWIATSPQKPHLNSEEPRLLFSEGPFFESPTPLNLLGYYINNFALSEPYPWKYPSQTRLLSLNELQGLSKERHPVKVQWIPVFAGSFSDTFLKIKEGIREGKIVKAVPHLTQKGLFDFPMPPAQRALQLIKALKPASFKNRTLIAWATPSQAYVGLSPEDLFGIQKNDRIFELSTMALAGTKESSQSHLLLSDPKERREHELVIEGLRKTLQNFTEKFHIAQTEVLGLGKISHLKTAILATLEEGRFDLAALIKSFHPTPALGTYPRVPFEFPRSCEYLGAPFAVHEAQDWAQVRVTLRGLRIFENHIELSCGCGVTESSLFEKEFEELELKRQSVKDLFGI